MIFLLQLIMFWRKLVINNFIMLAIHKVFLLNVQF